MEKKSLLHQNIYPQHLGLHSRYHQHLRNFLTQNQYIELWCPPISTAPCFETHVHPWQLYSPQQKKLSNLYLHTSPEFVLKSYLATYKPSTGIFSLNYVFRDDPPSPIHRKQFLMLEFYRNHGTLIDFYADIDKLLLDVSYFLTHENLEFRTLQPLQRISVDQLFNSHLHFSILDFIDDHELWQKMQLDFPEICPNKILPWDDLFHLLWLNFIEPNLKNYSTVLITDYPTPLSLLAKKNEANARCSDRFELFVDGVEIANGYSENLNHHENDQVINQHLKQKLDEYDYTLSKPDFFLENLKTVNLSNCFGVAIGTERLLQTLIGAKSAFIDFEPDT